MANEVEIRARLATDLVVVSKQLSDASIWSVQVYLLGNTLAALPIAVPEWLTARDDLLVSTPLEFGSEVQADAGEKALTQQVFELIDLTKTAQELLKAYSLADFSTWKETGVVPDVNEEGF